MDRDDLIQILQDQVTRRSKKGKGNTKVTTEGGTDDDVSTMESTIEVRWLAYFQTLNNELL